MGRDPYEEIKYVDDQDDEGGEEYPQQAEDYEDENDIDVPEKRGVSVYKYQVEPDVPIAQRDGLDIQRPFYGRHTALSNTKRSDNLHILDAYDVTTMLDDCPTLRHRSTNLRGRIITELQLFRSNTGFERRMESTIIKQQAIDVHDNRYEPEQKKKRFSLFGRKK